MFKSKAGDLIEKQYQENEDYFNLKIATLKDMLEKSKINEIDKSLINAQLNVQYDNYSDLILGVESKKLVSNINSIIKDDLVQQITWYENKLYCKKDFLYGKKE